MFHDIQINNKEQLVHDVNNITYIYSYYGQFPDLSITRITMDRSDSNVSHLTAFVLHERLYNWFLFHSIEIHPPFLTLMLEDYHVLSFSEGLIKDVS